MAGALKTPPSIHGVVVSPQVVGCCWLPLQDQEAHTKAVSTEREARSAAESDAVTVRRECERRVAELEAQLQEAQAALQAHGSSPHVESGGGPEPPAMAAPGYR